MTEQSGEPQPDPKEAPKEPKGDEAKFTQAQLNSFLANQKREIESKYDGFEEIKSKAEQLDQLTAAQKSDIQAATEAASEFKAKYEASQADVGKLTTQLQRQKISATAGLDPDLWDRVKGGTAEEIEADVKKLVEKFSVPKRTGALRSGASAAPDGAGGKRGAAALKGLRRD